LVKRWERFWFGEIPPHSYALLRILFGTLGFVSLLGETPVSMFWSLDGLTPVAGGGFGLRQELIHLGLSQLAGWTCFLGLLISFAAMTVGYRSRWIVAICYAGSFLQTKWNSLPLSSAHYVVIAVLFCLMWVDCGAVWSADEWLAARRRRPTATYRRASQPVWPLRLIRFQVALIYLSSGLWKLFSPLWRNGSAVHYVLHVNFLHRFPYAVPPNFDWILTALTYATLLWETGFAFLVLHRTTRTLALLAGIVIHLSMWGALELGPFSWVMLASYVAFLDPMTVERWATAWGSPAITGPSDEFGTNQRTVES
jgi:hypothetical protein